MKNQVVKNLTLSAMFIAIGIILPLITGQIPQIGNMLLPMHIPVLLCGLICGWRYGMAVGFILPLMRSFLFSMPPMYPIAISMAFELLAYGGVIGIIYGLFRKQNIASLYISLIISLLAGRAVWGAAMIVLLSFGEGSFTWQAFMAGAFVTAIPGIILQLILIPAIMLVLDRIGLVRFRNELKDE